MQAQPRNTWLATTWSKAFPHSCPLWHLPPSQIHPNTGTLSYHRIAVPHFGHFDAGATIDTSSGIRKMQTFRKLPITIPNRNTKMTIATVQRKALRRRFWSAQDSHRFQSQARPFSPICHTQPLLSRCLCALCALCGKSLSVQADAAVLNRAVSNVV